MTLQHLRSSTANKRPDPTAMADGQIALNTAAASPGLFYKDSAGNLVKVGPVHVGATAPNVSPASGGTAGNSVGEQWLDTTGGTYVFKVWDGSAWRSESGTFVDVNGDVMTGALGIIAGTAGSPGLYISGDTNTGIYSPGADQLALSTGGVQRVTVNTTVIDSSLPFSVYTASAGASLTGLTINNSSDNASTAARITLQPSTTFNRGCHIEAINSGASGQPCDLIFGTNPAFSTSTERLRITSAGLVGVGTASPSQKLEIGGSGRSTLIVGSTNSFAELSLTGAATENYITSDDTLAFYVNNLERLRITSAGLVGVGTSSPLALFDAKPSSNRHIVITSSASYADNGIVATNDAGGEVALGIGGTPIQFFTGATERMRLDSSGRLGIGTTSPAHKLVVSNGGVQNIEFNWDGASTNFIQSYNRSTSQYLPLSFYSSQHIFFNGANNSESGRFDSSGRLLVGTSSATATSTAKLQGNSFGSTSHAILYLSRGVNNPANGNDLGIIHFSDSSENLGASVYAFRDAGTWTSGSSHPTALAFSTTADGASSPTERMKIGSNGTILIGKTTAGIGNAGIELDAAAQDAMFTNYAATPVYVNRTFNDGVLIDFQQDSTTEGSISVSGTTVSYNGAHLSRWSQLPSGAERTEILRGTVLSNIDEMCEWGDEDNEQLNRMKVSDVEGDKNVSGVFQGWDDDDDTYTNDFYCAMTGDFIIRIGAGITVERGDLLMSAGDGTAKPQDDDIIRSKTIAKVTSTNVSCTYEDGSYCVPCVLMAC